MLAALTIAVFILNLLRQPWSTVAQALKNDLEIYPEYCAKTPLVPRARQSPPLSPADQARELDLRQVQVWIRHGMRTVDLKPHEVCWKTFPQPWNCEYEEAFRGTASHPTVMMNKVYDVNPSFHSGRGTCEAGQLLEEGAQQHRDIGRFIAQSYLLSTHPFKLPRPQTPPLLTNETLKTGLYIRSTDMQRTRLSAANLVTGLLMEAFSEPQAKFAGLQLHTMDYDYEYLGGSQGLCTKADEAARRAHESAAYQQLLDSFLPLKKKVESIIGYHLPRRSWTGPVGECVRAQLCADRWDLLPEGLRPTSPEAVALARAIHRADTLRYQYRFTYNASDYAKLSIAHVAHDMRKKLHEITTDETKPQLNIYVGHDTTIFPLLAVLGLMNETIEWPPYAATLILEAYEERLRAEDEKSNMNPLSRIFFRLVYNGVSTTTSLPECHNQELCPLDVLMKRTEWVGDALRRCDGAIRGLKRHRQELRSHDASAARWAFARQLLRL